jgi:hypothetical protein
MTELPKKCLVLRRRQKARYQDDSMSEENIRKVDQYIWSYIILCQTRSRHQNFF